METDPITPDALGDRPLHSRPLRERMRAGGGGLMNQIDETSDVYKRRLARELRDRIRGRRPVWFRPLVAGAGLRVLRIQTRRNMSTREFEICVRGETGFWVKLNPSDFANLVDDRGERIVATREPQPTRTSRRRSYD